MTPRISAVMPTADRRQFVPTAIGAFLAQGRDDSELVILDDGSDAIADLVPPDPRIRYFRETQRRALGDKRNRLCELARGEIIVHWDDDDWHAPDRISRQIAALETSGADICGCDRLLFLADDQSAAWEYIYGGSKPWVAGGTLCYRRSAWQQRHFSEVRAGEDTLWVFAAPRERLHIMADNSFYVARIHRDNTSPKKTHGSFYHRRNVDRVRSLIPSSKSTGGEAPDGEYRLANVYACLVHERPECVLDLVRNLRHFDRDSLILLYDGSATGDLLDPRLPWDRWGVERVANPCPMRWGTLHSFALACIAHLAGRDYDALTVVDSDQLMLKGGYNGQLSRALGARARTTLLSSDPRVQGRQTGIGPARTAQAEIDRWRGWLRRFPDGEAKFVHWTFWPATVIGSDCGRSIAELFADNELAAILSGSKLWATEEILFPTFAALLGFEVARNPCSSTFVQYKTPWRLSDLDRAIADPHAYFMHPVPRRLDDPLRSRIREAHDFYRIAEPLQSRTDSSSLWSLLAEMRSIEGWLTDEEAEALLRSARSAVARKGASGRIVEIGCFCGKATYVLARAAQSAPIETRVIAVDSFDGIVGTREGKLECHGSTRARFDATVAQFGLEPWVEAHVGRPDQLSASGLLDLLVVDGLHDYPAIVADFYALQHLVPVGGRVAFHDYAPYFPSVCAFVDELAAGREWKVETCAGTLRVLTRRAVAKQSRSSANPAGGQKNARLTRASPKLKRLQ